VKLPEKSGKTGLGFVGIEQKKIFQKEDQN
jgi:hypothetical protein